MNATTEEAARAEIDARERAWREELDYTAWLREVYGDGRDSEGRRRLYGAVRLVLAQEGGR